jgi:general stress protein 26
MSDHTHDPDKIWHLADDITICMFITHDGTRHRARPMAAYVRPDEHAIYFLTDAESAKAHQTEHDQSVTLAFADKGHNDYVTISGPASVGNDRAKIRDLFNVFAKAWWESADDPAIRLIKIAPEEAEYWESPNGPVATIKMLASAATGHRPDLGDNAKVNL